MIRAVLFDMDGVLVDSYEVWYHLMEATAKDLGYPPVTRERFQEGWGQGVQADVARFFTNHTVGQIEAHYEAHYREHMEHLKVNPQSSAVFRMLKKKGKSLAVITNTPAPLAREILRRAELKPDLLVGGTDVPNGKPAPDMVLRAVEKLNVSCGESLVVGDSRYDREAAEAAFVRFAGLGIDGDLQLKQLKDVLQHVG